MTRPVGTPEGGSRLLEPSYGKHDFNLPVLAVQSRDFCIYSIVGVLGARPGMHRPLGVPFVLPVSVDSSGLGNGGLVGPPISLNSRTNGLA